MTTSFRHIRLFWAAVLILGVGSGFCATPPGVRPVGKDGKPLNLDFEDGTLKDWKAEGKAFEGQPIKGDTVFPRRNDMRSNHQGFKFYAERPDFENELDPDKELAESPPADVVPFAGLSPQEAAKNATLPSGFRMHVFAAEPDVRQPIAFCLDDRGRV